MPDSQNQHIQQLCDSSKWHFLCNYLLFSQIISLVVIQLTVRRAPSIRLDVLMFDTYILLLVLSENQQLCWRGFVWPSNWILGSISKTPPCDNSCVEILWKILENFIIYSFLQRNVKNSSLSYKLIFFFKTQKMVLHIYFSRHSCGIIGTPQE